MTAGYSGTPLIKKLGIKPGMQVCFINAPENYEDLLGPLPDDLTTHTTPQPESDFIHFFTKEKSTLETEFPALKAVLTMKGMLWISWPKKASQVKTDLDDNIVRTIGLEHGLVDVKVAAVDSIWSGLKFVYRKADRR